MYPLTSPASRRSVGVAAAIAFAALALTACKSSTTTNAAGNPTPTAGAQSGATTPTGAATTGGGGGATGCTDALKTAIGGLVTAPVGDGTNQLSGTNSAYACLYGIGKNATLTGSALSSAPDDTVLVSVISVQGASQYANAVGYGKPIAVPGVGDKAEYFFFPQSGQVPDLYALKGAAYCEVQINAADVAKELGVPAQGPSGGVTATGAATIAQHEGAVCNAAFGG